MSFASKPPPSIRGHFIKIELIRESETYAEVP
jgi:hypothetical protein